MLLRGRNVLDVSKAPRACECVVLRFDIMDERVPSRFVAVHPGANPWRGHEERHTKP